VERSAAEMLASKLLGSRRGRLNCLKRINCSGEG